MEKVFLVNVYKKGRRKYFMDVIVNYNQYIINIILLFYIIITVRFFFFRKSPRTWDVKNESKKSFYQMYLLGIYDLLIIAYCNYMAILSSLFVLLLTNLIVRN